METKHTISRLVRKRAEIASQLDAAQMQVRQLIINLDSLDATIRLFAPDFDLEEIRPKPMHPATRRSRGDQPDHSRRAARDRRGAD